MDIYIFLCISISELVRNWKYCYNMLERTEFRKIWGWELIESQHVTFQSFFSPFSMHFLFLPIFLPLSPTGTCENENCHMGSHKWYSKRENLLFRKLPTLSLYEYIFTKDIYIWNVIRFLAHILKIFSTKGTWDWNLKYWPLVLAFFYLALWLPASHMTSLAVSFSICREKPEIMSVMNILYGLNARV